MTLARYLAGRFLRSFFRVSLIVMLLMGLFEGIENIRRFSDKTDDGRDILILTILQLPEQINQVLPLIMLLTSLTLFLGLARSSELVVSRAAGLSAFRVLAVPMGLAVVLGLLSIALLNPIVAATIRKYDTMRASILQTDTSVLSISEGGVWLRQVVDDSQTVIQAQRSSPDGTVLYDVEFHIFDADGALTDRILASAATLDAGTWLLADVRHWRPSDPDSDAPPTVRSALEDTLPTNLTSAQILDSFAKPETISVWELGQFIGQMETSGFTATRHKLFLQSVLATPVVFAAMVLIGASFTMRHVRFGHAGIMVLLTVLSGFALYSFRSIAESLGAAGNIPISIAAWTPPIAALLLVTALLLHLEDG